MYKCFKNMSIDQFKSSFTTLYVAKEKNKQEKKCMCRQVPIYYSVIRERTVNHKYKINCWTLFYFENHYRLSIIENAYYDVTIVRLSLYLAAMTIDFKMYNICVGTIYIVITFEKLYYNDLRHCYFVQVHYCRVTK